MCRNDQNLSQRLHTRRNLPLQPLHATCYMRHAVCNGSSEARNKLVLLSTLFPVTKLPTIKLNGGRKSLTNSPQASCQTSIQNVSLIPLSGEMPNANELPVASRGLPAQYANVLVFGKRCHCHYLSRWHYPYRINPVGCYHCIRRRQWRF
jgi:hypothetical protein